ncbi:uncharacterized protein LY89DRAFT_759825 [Mollisia scopiformis]|uniref:F-box domain-containing protein n=1 Tax=Mollisia scopiformis TaxID=149040 RepID=A0A194WSF1_MOLSC|nr:uncharacterized protein LY89DRAFT_759825 [Mollisia scopiformis]KUJ10891.1 hypothetical protein LY89DRAFT_759825 [Mollisia scopiformis]
MSSICNDLHKSLESNMERLALCTKDAADMSQDLSTEKESALIEQKGLSSTASSSSDQEDFTKTEVEAVIPFQRPVQKGHLELLPVELQCEIFKYLGPGAKRILGSISKRMYDIWKQDFFEKSIRINIAEHMLKADSLEHVSTVYNSILSNWLRPKGVAKDQKTETDTTYGDVNSSIHMNDCIEDAVARHYAAKRMKEHGDECPVFTKEFRYKNVILEYTGFRNDDTEASWLSSAEFGRRHRRWQLDIRGVDLRDLFA